MRAEVGDELDDARLYRQLVGFPLDEFEQLLVEGRVSERSGRGGPADASVVYHIGKFPYTSVGETIGSPGKGSSLFLSYLLRLIRAHPPNR